MGFGGVTTASVVTPAMAGSGTMVRSPRNFWSSGSFLYQKPHSFNFSGELVVSTEVNGVSVKYKRRFNGDFWQVWGAMSWSWWHQECGLEFHIPKLRQSIVQVVVLAVWECTWNYDYHHGDITGYTPHQSSGFFDPWSNYGDCAPNAPSPGWRVPNRSRTHRWNCNSRSYPYSWPRVTAGNPLGPGHQFTSSST